MTTEMVIRFEGPFSWRKDGAARCIFDAPEGGNHGVYLWTLPMPEGRAAYYIGETGRSFASRHREHLREHMAGFYHLLDPDELARGRKRVVWNGMYGVKTRETIQALFDRWHELCPLIERQTRTVEFFLAKCSAELSIRREIERSLAVHFAGQSRNFQDGGVWYRGAGKPIAEMPVCIESSAPVLDLPKRLMIGSSALPPAASAVFVTT